MIETPSFGGHQPDVPWFMRQGEVPGPMEFTIREFDPNVEGVPDFAGICRNWRYAVPEELCFR